MKKLFTLAFLLFGCLPVAFAQYGTWRYVPNTGSWVPPGTAIAPQPYYGGGYAQPQYVQQPQYYGNQPQYYGNPGYANNSGISNCTVLGAGIGGVAGNVIDHHHAGGTIAGAIIGGALGSMVCNNNQGQRVVEQRQYREAFSNTARYDGDVSGQQQVVTSSYERRPQTIHVPAKCKFENGITVYTDEGRGGCDKVAAAMTTRIEGQTVAQVPSVPVAQTTSKPQGGVCRIVAKDSGKTYRFNAVSGVKIDKATCLQYLGETLPLPAESTMSILP